MNEDLKRRLISVPRLYLMLALVTVTFPVLLALAALVDGARAVFGNRTFVAVRLVAFGWVFLAVEAAGLAMAFGAWIVSGLGRNRRRFLSLAYGIQRWWGDSQFAAIRRLFSLDLVVHDHEEVAPGPIVLMFRHASIIDNLLPVALVTSAKRINLRWIIKRELLADPALDIVGNILPNYFVDRRGNTAEEAASIRRLASDMGAHDGLLIYPEGTRFTDEKRQRVIARLERTDPEAAERARTLRHVLPPRPAGALAALAGTSTADVVLAAHTGLDGFAHISDIWKGRIVGNTIEVGFRRIPRSQVPEARSEQVAWLANAWQWVDDWIETHRA